MDVESITAELTAVFGIEAESPLAGLFRFVPMERLGAVMVITPREDYLRTAEEWIEKLDRGAAGAGTQLYVYRVKNLEASVLAGYLAQLFSGGGGGTDRGRQTNLAPGLEPVTMSSVSGFNQNRETANTTGVPGSGQQGRGGGSSTIQTEEGEIRITSVMETNSLLIQATQSQYNSILAAIERIDEEPLQVLIESQVMDVELNEQLQFGVNWFLTNNPDLIPADSGNPYGRVIDSVEFGSGGDSGFNVLGTLSDYISGGKTFIAATIAALDSVTDVRSLAAPSLVVRNNAQATITVGTQVPVQSSAISTGNQNIVSSAQYVSTGVTLTVTPRINPGGLVYMDITQEVSRPGARDPDVSTSGNPPISNKSVTSQVAVQSGQTVFLGGLITESDDQGRTGVPFLSRIPGLGSVFGSRSSSKSRAETIVMITPTVLESSTDLREVTDDLRDEFIRIDPIRITTLQDEDSEQ
ncbi:MAG: secretin N-terminal domain-containing protein [Gammaproteobacteria bacterium]